MWWLIFDWLLLSGLDQQEKVITLGSNIEQILHRCLHNIRNHEDWERVRSEISDDIQELKLTGRIRDGKLLVAAFMDENLPEDSVWKHFLVRFEIRLGWRTLKFEERPRCVAFMTPCGISYEIDPYYSTAV